MSDYEPIWSMLEKQFRVGLSVHEKEILNNHLKTEIGERVLRAFLDEKGMEAFDDSDEIQSVISNEMFANLQSTLKGHKTRNQILKQRTWLPPTKMAASFVGLLLVALSSYFIHQHYFGQVTHITTYGQRKTIVLPDFSSVTLNGNSSLRYRKSWENASEREVHLTGEAFFSVVKRKQQHFLVRTAGATIKVLGTSFNVKSYAEDATIEATLVEGSVIVQQNDETEGTIMHPNEKATITKQSGEIAISRVEPEKYIAWRSGKLIFEDTPFGEIIKELERKYGVRILVSDKEAIMCRFSASTDKESLKELLDLFQSTTDLAYTVNGNQVTITGKLCKSQPKTL